MNNATAIKLGLALGGVLVVAYLANRASSVASSAASAVYDAAASAANAVNPWNQNNVIYQTANQAGDVISPDPDGAGRNADGSWTWGGFFHDVLNPGTAQAVRDMSKPITPTPKNPPPEWDYTAGFSP